jgi:hypothetical protein
MTKVLCLSIPTHRAGSRRVNSCPFDSSGLAERGRKNCAVVKWAATISARAQMSVFSAKKGPESTRIELQLWAIFGHFCRQESCNSL